MNSVKNDKVTPAVEIQNLHKSFGSLEVLKGIDLSVSAGEVICILGASGSGKSTMLRCINQLIKPDSGKVFVHGDPIGYTKLPDGTFKEANKKILARQRSNIGYVFQQFNLWPHRTVLGNVVDALIVVKNISRAEAKEIALKRIDEVGLTDWCDDYPSTLSGGQQQRVAIARMLAMEPGVMLFDEPTSALDPERVSEVIDVMRQLANDGNTMLIATHEMNFARDTADRAIFIENGKIIEQASAAEFFSAPKTERLQSFLKRMST